MAEIGKSVEKYLSYRPELPFTWQEMLEQKKILSVDELIHHLELARGYLRNTPGPHQESRKDLEPDWLGWWHTFFIKNRNYLKKNRARKKLKTLSEVAVENQKMNSKQNITASYFANGLEGHAGHRWAIQYIVTALQKGYVGLFLDEKITPGKARDQHYLPLEMRLSMWAYFFVVAEQLLGDSEVRELDYLTVIPENRSLSPGEYYDKIFFESRAKNHFVMEGDPHFFEKVARNRHDGDGSGVPDVFVFPPVDIASTTGRVQWLRDQNEYLITLPRRKTL